MNPKTLVRLSNIVGTISILLLIYWVFVFISIQVFGLKVFRENMTETFFMSVLGILALMFGALIINIMFNLTRIAQKHNQDDIETARSSSKKIGIIFIISFPLVFGLLYGGDYLTSKKKEKMLIESAESIIQDNTIKANKLTNYSFDKKWIKETSEILDLLSKTDKNFPSVSVIVKDEIDHSTVLLGFNYYYYDIANDTIHLSKSKFIYETTKEEREYLNKVFDKKFKEIRFSAHDGNYELYYPYFKDNKKIVLYFSDYQRYGKLGS
ncbi:MAG: hypothetical protein A3F72_16695 [Bacteroidetes bacterium RIFCSPLOWO2_12_FULL_35_15]|nr:MAG: hypothetical protein A3F72_16695 [Bacteroidetes bacterium RIFCSPLOWO2_12_FULL_35_15]